jgi:hypothetical protein
MDAVRAYIKNLYEMPSKENEQYHWNQRSELFNTMLFEMSKELKTGLTEADIRTTGYKPSAHVNLETAQQKVMEWLTAIAEGKQSIPVVNIVSEEVLRDQIRILMWLANVAKGEDSIPTRDASLTPGS